MSLIQKPFDDSGVSLVDDIARYGVAISKRLERLKASGSFSLPGNRQLLSAAVAFAACDVISDIIRATGENSYRVECAGAARTFALDSGGFENHPPVKIAKAINPATHAKLMEGIKEVLREPGLIAGQEQVTTQTVLLALVWSSLVLLAEVVPIEEARKLIENRILEGHRPLS
jgi:hypothetical protein